MRHPGGSASPGLGAVAGHEVRRQAGRSVFHEVWLARFVSLPESRSMLARAIEADDGDRAALSVRLELLIERSQPQSAASWARYQDIASRLDALGDRTGCLIARSWALVATQFQGDLTASWAEYSDLATEIELLEDPLDRYMAASSALVLLQANGAHSDYLQHVLKLLQLSVQIQHDGLHAAALCNVGQALLLIGDEVGALGYLEQSLSAAERCSSRVTMNSVCLLAQIYLSLGEDARVGGLIKAWVFPQDLRDLDVQVVHLLHLLGAQVSAMDGRAEEASALLSYANSLPREHLCPQGACYGLMAAASVAHARGRREEACRLVEALQGQLEVQPSGEMLLRSHAALAIARIHSAQGDWQSAARHLDLHREMMVRVRRQAAESRSLAVRAQMASQKVELEEAQSDHLTGLPNWDRIKQVGDAWVAKKVAALAVVMLNVRRFSAINAALGREVGDAVLVAIAQRLQRSIGSDGMAQAGRAQSDQFCLLYRGVIDASEIHARLSGLFRDPIVLGEQAIDVRMAMGIACYPRDASTMRTLMINSELALQADRRSGVGWTVFQPHLATAKPVHLSLLTELKLAAERNEFELHLQPKFRLKDGYIGSAEALVRWRHPVRGLIPPADFIPFAEQTGGIRDITRWVLREAIAQTLAFRAMGHPIQIAVNVSLHDLSSPGFAAEVMDLLGDAGANPGDLRLEITESTVMRDPGAIIERMTALGAIGVNWSIDDFGTGQSSLSYLHRLPVTELKIDRSFVHGAAQSMQTRTLLTAAIELGRSLGLATVAEGAETAEEWALLRSLECSYAQGWFGAAAMPAAEMMRWLAQRTS